jgi:hypothetical protein
MRVAIDATPLILSSGGLRRYTEELSLALARSFPEDEFFLVSDQPFAAPTGSPANLLRGGGPRHAAERRWWLWGLDRELHRLEAGLFHGTDFAVPYVPRRPSVLTIHDLSPWMDAAWHSDADRVRKRTPLLIGLRLATMILTPSEAVRKQAMERFRIHPNRIRAVPHAASAVFRPVAATPAPWSPARICPASSPRGARSAGAMPWIWYWLDAKDLISRNFHRSRGCTF